MNKWHEVWEKRSGKTEIFESGDFKKIFLELKRINGWDSTGDMLGFEQFFEQYIQTKKEFEQKGKIKSVFEVGCGSGANLYLFQNDGVEVGGIDYSSPLIKIAEKVLANPRELICNEAANVPVEIKYDVVLSNSVFSYFNDYDYAYKVLEAMYKKANHSIGIIDIHDIEKKEGFIKYRVSETEDYQERYKDLPKLFYEKEFFSNFAKEHNMELRFVDSVMEGYWNNEFVFNCFMVKA